MILFVLVIFYFIIFREENEKMINIHIYIFRYYAICHPTLFQMKRENTNVWIEIVIAAFTGITMQIPNMMEFGVRFVPCFRFVFYFTTYVILYETIQRLYYL